MSEKKQLTSWEFFQKHSGEADTWQIGRNKFVSVKRLHFVIDKLFDKASKETATYRIPYGDALYDLEKEVKKAFKKPKEGRKK